MPIKFKCECGHILTVADKFAGKEGKCPKCQKKLRVPRPKAPAGGSAPAAAGMAASQTKKTPQAKKATKAAAASTPSKLDSLFDDAGLVQKTGPTCPQCMVDIKPNTVVCTNCGFNTQTGETLAGFDAQVNGPEFDNAFLQEAADNMRRDLAMDSRRAKAQMPWWVLMSFLIGAVTLCAAGVVIIDGQFGTPDPETTFIGKVQRLPVFIVLGCTACVTGIAITCFAHLSIVTFAFGKSIGQGFACLFLPLFYSIVYGIMNWTDNKAPVKAIIVALIFLSAGVGLILQGGGFGVLRAVL